MYYYGIAKDAQAKSIMDWISGKRTVAADQYGSQGEDIYFFEFACGLSGYLLGVNPFDQPGVEAYKKNMFALLGKPGYEEERTALERRLS